VGQQLNKIRVDRKSRAKIKLRGFALYFARYDSNNSKFSMMIRSVPGVSEFVVSSSKHLGKVRHTVATVDDVQYEPARGVQRALPRKE